MYTDDIITTLLTNKDYFNTIAQNLDMQCVMLGGSRVRGTAESTSDYDLIIYVSEQSADIIAANFEKYFNLAMQGILINNKHVHGFYLTKNYKHPINGKGPCSAEGLIVNISKIFYTDYIIWGKSQANYEQIVETIPKYKHGVLKIYYENTLKLYITKVRANLISERKLLFLGCYNTARLPFELSAKNKLSRDDVENILQLKRLCKYYFANPFTDISNMLSTELRTGYIKQLYQLEDIILAILAEQPDKKID